MHPDRRRARLATSLVAVLLLAALLSPAPAVGQDLAQTPHQQESRREFNIVPLIGGSSDVGLGFGQASDWARLGPQYHPYRWRISSEAFISFKVRQGADLIVPFQDYAVQVILPELGPEKRLRLTGRLSFTDESTLKFYAFGNASPLPPSDVSVSRTEYGRTHPTLSLIAGMKVASGWFLHTGGVYTHNWLDVPPDSLLAQAQALGSPDVQRWIGGFDSHGVLLTEVGVAYDSRDNEVVTRQGMLHRLRVRLSPRVPGWLPYAYQQVNLTTRSYLSPLRRLTLAWRVVGDVMFGAPPFYELARFDETAAIGGGKAIRGVPAQRYYGKVKLFQNLEARTDLFGFSLVKKRMLLGAALFFDAGRSWMEAGRRHPELDGTGVGLKYGIGGGLRLQQGETLVIRFDVAWSPDARPLGAYFAAGQIF